MLEVSFSSFPLLQTHRCRLRCIEADDASTIFLLRSDAEVMRYLDRESFAGIEEAMAMIDKIKETYSKGEGISWAVSLADDECMIGMAGLWRITKEHHRAEIGYTLLPAYWKKGIMSEVLEKIIAYGFDELNLHSIEANVNPHNQASIRLLEKFGFSREGYMKENYFFRDQFLDSAIYSLVRKK